MTKANITQYDSTPSNNADINDINIAENCPASNINNAIRELMAHLKNVDTGSQAMTSPSFTAMSTDTISEKTSANGVAIDSVTLKDGELGTTASPVPINSSSLNGGQFGGRRNIIINGAMKISQRSTSTASISSGNNFVLDRTRFQLSNGGTWTMSQSTTVPSGQGFSYSLKLDCTTADTSLGSTDFLLLQQLIEGQDVQQFAFGTSDAKSVTVSFWIRSNKTGTYTLEVQQQNSSNGFYQNAKTFTISSANTWEKKEITFVGNASQNIINSNAVGFYVTIWLGTGTSRTSGTFTNGTWHNTTANRVSSSNVNLADSTDNELYLTGLQLEVGTATPFEHRSFGEELRLAQRYHYRINGKASGGTTIGMGFSNVTTQSYSHIALPVNMRTSPSVTGSGFTASDFNSYTITGTSLQITADENSSQGCSRTNLIVNVSSGLTTLRPSGNALTASTSSFCAFDSEL